MMTFPACVLMRPSCRSSCKVRFTCTVESPSASPSSAWVSGIPKAWPFTRPTALHFVYSSQNRCAMRAVGFAAAEACHPLAEDRGIDERVAPEDIADARVGADEGPHRLVRDERHLARDDRAQAVVHDVDWRLCRSGMSPGIWNEKICRLPPSMTL